MAGTDDTADTDDKVVPHERVRSLRRAVSAARIADADRTDALEERRQSEHLRLELAVRELEGVFTEAAEAGDQFVLSISKGATPRLWIDATSHVAMASDIRNYRFVKDTRLGRIVLTETDDVGVLADRVTAYIAERVVDRERAVEADWQVWRINEQARKEAAEAARTAAGAADGEAAPRRRGRAVVGFLIGLLVGSAGLAGALQAAGLYDFRTHLSALRANSALPTPVRPAADGAKPAAPQDAAADAGSSSGRAAPAE